MAANRSFPARQAHITAEHYIALYNVPPHSGIRQVAIKTDYALCQQSEICFSVLYMSHCYTLFG